MKYSETSYRPLENWLDEACGTSIEWKLLIRHQEDGLTVWLRVRDNHANTRIVHLCGVDVVRANVSAVEEALISVRSRREWSELAEPVPFTENDAITAIGGRHALVGGRYLSAMGKRLYAKVWVVRAKQEAQRQAGFTR